MKGRKQLIKILLGLVFFFVLVLLVLLIFNFNAFVFFDKLFEGAEEISIKDDCGIVLGNLIHEIKNEDSCVIMCRNECGLENKAFVKVDFDYEGDPCYKCNCFCK